MTFVRKLNRNGAILIIIVSIFELFYAGKDATPISISLICLLVGFFILLATPQLEYDYKVQWAAGILAAQWFINSYLHEVLGYEWTTSLGGIGKVLIIIGIIFVILAGIFVILGAAIGAIVVQNIGLFKPYQYILFGIEIITIHNSILFFWKFIGGATFEQLIPEIICYILLGIMLLGTFLIQKKKKIIGSLIIWVACAINSVYTKINGFYGGAVIVSMFAFITMLFAFLNHWADPYTRKTQLPRRDLSLAIKDSFTWLLGLIMIGKSRKAKKKVNIEV
ncbi:MAG: hypothetical protein ACTSQJ_07015 [Promethearchaeota archaeon]